VGNFSLETTQELQLHCPTFFMGSAGFLVNRTPKYSLVSKLLRIFNANYVSGFQVPFCWTHAIPTQANTVLREIPKARDQIF
jgi:hypothetical protein